MIDALATVIGGVSVSRETMDRLEGYETELRKWNERINLVSRSSLADIRERHVFDSAQLWPLGSGPAVRWLDLGSGAGFPGLVIDILARQLAPGMEVLLVESDQRKSAFLRHVIQTINLTAKVLTSRIEALPPQQADVVSARALAPLDQLLSFARKHKTADGICLFPKGRTVHKEIADAERLWRFDYRLHPSCTQSEAAVVEIGAITGA